MGLLRDRGNVELRDADARRWSLRRRRPHGGRGSLRRDDRGQAVQVGAAVLLAFVVLAITVYQVQVVPGQNAEIEFDHSQSVQEDVQDVRNAITNAGARESSESRSVSLGTRFPARTIFVNPPPARGLLATEVAGNVSIRNARVAPDGNAGSDAAALLAENHTTARLVYRPDYREYSSEPTSVVEHSLAYSALRNDVTQRLTGQTLVRGDRLSLTLLDGELAVQGTRAVNVEVATASGPSDPVPIEPEDDARPIAIDLPVVEPDPWNETIGRTYAEGQADARVASYDANASTVTVELAGDDYDLRMALVGVGENVTSTDRYDVRTSAGDGGGGGSASPAYAVDWLDPSGQSSVDDEQCDAERCVVTGDAVDLSIATDPVADGAGVEFAVGDRSVATVSPTSTTTDGSGEATATLEVASGAEDGDTVRVYASSGSDGDAIEVEVRRDDDGTSTPSAAMRVEDLSHQPGSETRYYASYELEGVADDHDRTAVAFRNRDTGDTTWRNGTTLRDTVTYEAGGGTGDEYEIEVLALDASGAVLASDAIVDDAADGHSPDGNADLGDADSPSLTRNDVVDQSSWANGAQWEVDYAAETTNVGSVQLDAVSLDPNSGGQAGVEGLPASGTEQLSTYGYQGSPDQQNDFRVTTIVYDQDGVIVDVATVVDTSDGTDP